MELIASAWAQPLCQ